MSPKDEQQPTDPDADAPDEDVDAAPVDPAQEQLDTSLQRVLRALQKTLAGRDEIADWLAGWWPLIAAAKSLVATATALASQVPKMLRADGDEPSFDAATLAELGDQFGELIEAFPEASAWFFGADHVDSLAHEISEDEEMRAVVARFSRVLDAKTNGLIERLVDWGLEEDGRELSVDRLERFVRRLEPLLQEVLDRWVLPTVYGKFDDE